MVPLGDFVHFHDVGFCVFVFLSLKHLQSNQHRTFVLDPLNYSLVDQLVVEMLPEFDPNPPQQEELSRSAWIMIYFDIDLFIFFLFSTDRLYPSLDFQLLCLSMMSVNWSLFLIPRRSMLFRPCRDEVHH